MEHEAQELELLDLEIEELEVRLAFEDIDPGGCGSCGACGSCGGSTCSCTPTWDT